MNKYYDINILQSSIANTKSATNTTIPFVVPLYHIMNDMEKENQDRLLELWFYLIIQGYYNVNKNLYNMYRKKYDFKKGWNTNDTRILFDENFLKYIKTYFSKSNNLLDYLKRLVDMSKNNKLNYLTSNLMKFNDEDLSSFKKLKQKIKSRRIWLGLKSHNEAFPKKEEKANLSVQFPVYNYYNPKVKKLFDKQKLTFIRFRQLVILALASKPEATYFKNTHNYVCGLSQESIAKITGLSLSSVNQILKENKKIYNFLKITKQEYDNSIHNPYRRRFMHKIIKPEIEIINEKTGEITKQKLTEYYILVGTKALNDVNFNFFVEAQFKTPKGKKIWKRKYVRYITTQSKETDVKRFKPIEEDKFVRNSSYLFNNGFTCKTNRKVYDTVSNSVHNENCEQDTINNQSTVSTNIISCTMKDAINKLKVISSCRTIIDYTDYEFTNIIRSKRNISSTNQSISYKRKNKLQSANIINGLTSSSLNDIVNDFTHTMKRIKKLYNIDDIKEYLDTYYIKDVKIKKHKNLS